MHYEVELKFPVPDLPAFFRNWRINRFLFLLPRRRAIYTSPIPHETSPKPTKPSLRREVMPITSPIKARRSTLRPRPVARSNCHSPRGRIEGRMDRVVGSRRFPSCGGSPQVPPQGCYSLARPPCGGVSGRRHWRWHVRGIRTGRRGKRGRSGPKLHPIAGRVAGPDSRQAAKLPGTLLQGNDYVSGH